MKKARKILSIVLPVLVIAMFMFVAVSPVVMADEPAATSSTGVPNTMPATGTGISTVDALAGNVWKTVLGIAQILAFAAIIFAGIRYMFASADQKADIKKGLIYLVIGAILVFAATTVVQVIISATEAATGTSDNVEMVRTIENV